MCSTVIFRYVCGCTERTVFECPFSSATSLTSKRGAHARSNQSCARRHRRHLKRLLRSETQRAATVTEATTPSPRLITLPLRTKTPVLSPPRLSRSQLVKPERRNLIEVPITEVDEMCHDCWIHGLQVAKQRDNDKDLSIATPDDEDNTDDLTSTHVLKERSVNELALLSSPSTDEETVSSESPIEDLIEDED
ncbi:hypothetical protein F4861DRAFT_441744 [Xylaria intraflava]|nr:hypothetical protein F4861DRAFT_441744 [Xylaria intraflava]